MVENHDVQRLPNHYWRFEFYSDLPETQSVSWVVICFSCSIGNAMVEPAARFDRSHGKRCSHENGLERNLPYKVSRQLRK